MGIAVFTSIQSDCSCCPRQFAGFALLNSLHIFQLVPCTSCCFLVTCCSLQYEEFKLYFSLCGKYKFLQTLIVWYRVPHCSLWAMPWRAYGCQWLPSMLVKAKELDGAITGHQRTCISVPSSVRLRVASLWILWRVCWQDRTLVQSFSLSFYFIGLKLLSSQRSIEKIFTMPKMDSIPILPMGEPWCGIWHQGSATGSAFLQAGAVQALLTSAWPPHLQALLFSLLVGSAWLISLWDSFLRRQMNVSPCSPMKYYIT